VAGAVAVLAPSTVTLSSANQFRDFLEGPRFVTRPISGLLESSIGPGGPDFDFACGSCASPSNAFRESFERICGVSNSQLPGRDVCVRSAATGRRFTLRVLSWPSGGGDPSAAYQRNATLLGPVPYGASLLPSGIDITSLTPGIPYALEVLADDGQSLPAVAAAGFQSHGESEIAFVVLPTPTPTPAP